MGWSVIDYHANWYVVFSRSLLTCGVFCTKQIGCSAFVFDDKTLRCELGYSNEVELAATTGSDTMNVYSLAGVHLTQIFPNKSFLPFT
jgi:hypothetical protein